MYTFTSDWFSGNIPVWENFFKELRPRRVLEIGSYEGRSTIFTMESIYSTYGEGLVTCVDTWSGGLEHDPSSMSMVEQNFRSNISKACETRPNLVAEIKKDISINALSRLISDGRSGFYDLAYVDGSHQAADVITDLVLSYALVRVGGMIICDDYLWTMRRGNPIDDPKIAIDTFTTIYYRKVGILRGPLYQMYMRKVA